MKKILFSAIAMVAFAGSAFASNEVNEQVEKLEIVNSSTPCADMWTTDYNYYRAIGYTVQESNKRANENFDKCIETTYPSTKPSTSVGLNP